jgi:hypothetical protein
VIGMSALATRVILKHHWVDLMFRQHRGWAADVLFGILLSVMAMATLFIVFLGSDWLKVQDWRWHTESTIAWFGILLDIGEKAH